MTRENGSRDVDDLELVRLDDGPISNIQRILEWVDAFGCERLNVTRPGSDDHRPCNGDDAEVCIPCAASYALGLAEDRHAVEHEEHQRIQRLVAGVTKDGG